METQLTAAEVETIRSSPIVQKAMKEAAGQAAKDRARAIARFGEITAETIAKLSATKEAILAKRVARDAMKKRLDEAEAALRSEENAEVLLRSACESEQRAIQTFCKRTAPDACISEFESKLRKEHSQLREQGIKTFTRPTGKTPIMGRPEVETYSNEAGIGARVTAMMRVIQNIGDLRIPRSGALMKCCDTEAATQTEIDRIYAALPAVGEPIRVGIGNASVEPNVRAHQPLFVGGRD